MTDHTHREIVAGCYRCELGQDEAALTPFGFEWDNVNREWLLVDRDGDLISRHPTLIDAELAAAEVGR